MEHERHARAGDITQDRALPETREQLFDEPRLGQRIDRAGHVEQARKEDAEADGDVADGLGVFEEAPHDEHDADDEGDGGQCGGLEEAKEAGAGGVDVQETNDLACDRGAHVGADDDAQALVQGEDARAHEAGGDDDGGRGALDEGGDQHAQDKGLQGVVRHLPHGRLQGAGGVLLQGVPHEAHAVQEHRKAAQQGDHVEYIHKKPRSFGDPDIFLI